MYLFCIKLIEGCLRAFTVPETNNSSLWAKSHVNQLFVPPALADSPEPGTQNDRVITDLGKRKFLAKVRKNEG